MSHEYCVIGDPIEHSLSPIIHNSAFEKIGKKSNYDKIHVLPEDLGKFMAESRQNSRPGFNITVPHKETIIPYLDKIDDAAKNIGAVNTVVNQNGLFVGYNTDVFGFQYALKRTGFKTAQKTIILGSGGVARAAVEALARMDFSEIVLFDVIAERSRALCDHFKQFHDIKLITGSLENSDLKAHLPTIDLLVNATPVGMWPKVDQSPLDCPELFPEGATIFDLVYRPLETQLMKDVAPKKAKPVSGLAMLVAQALEADKLYFNQDIPDSLFLQIFDEVNEYLDKKQK